MLLLCCIVALVHSICMREGKRVKSNYIREIQIDWSEISKESYLRRIPALSGMENLEFDSPVTIFCGENGTGKSTLLEAIASAAGFNPEGGSKNYMFSTHADYSELNDAIRLVRGIRREQWGYFFRADSFFNVATAEEEYGKLSMRGSARYHYMSHGESFLKLMQESLSGDGLFLLDEPDEALSPLRQMTMLYEICRTVKEGAQFVIATHSPILLGIPDAQILSFDGGSVHPITYEETDSYRIMKGFLNDRERYLKNLLSQE